MSNFIIIELLNAECDNDEKARVYLDSEGIPYEFDSIDEAKECGIENRVSKFIVCQKVSEEINLPYDPDYD